MSVLDQFKQPLKEDTNIDDPLSKFKEAPKEEGLDESIKENTPGLLEGSVRNLDTSTKASRERMEYFLKPVGEKIRDLFLAPQTETIPGSVESIEGESFGQNVARTTKELLKTPFSKVEQAPGETNLQTFNRYLGQVPAAAIEKAGIPLNIASGAVVGEAKYGLSPELMEGVDKEVFQGKVDELTKYLPTTGNIISGIEKYTGLPLEAKTPGQQRLRNFMLATSFSHGAPAEKLLAGAKAVGYSEAYKKMGASDDFADLLGFMQSGYRLPSWEAASKPFKDSLLASRIRQGVETGEKAQQNLELNRMQELAKEKLATGVEDPFIAGLKPERELLERVNVSLEGVHNAEVSEKLGKLTKPVLTPTETPISPSLIPQQTPFDLERSVGQVVSPTKVPKTPTLIDSTRNIFLRTKNAVLRPIQRLYNTTEKALGNVQQTQQQMMGQLQDLIRELEAAPNPTAIQKDILNTAQQFVELGTIEGDVDRLMRIPTRRIVAQIKANNSKGLYDFIQGDAKNQYMRLNNILEGGVENAVANNPELERTLTGYRQAQQMFGDYARSFRTKSGQALSSALKSPVAMKELLSDAKGILELGQGLNQSVRGQRIYDSLRRDYIEKKLSPYFQDPTLVGSVKYGQTMKDLELIATPSERFAIESRLENAQSVHQSNQRLINSYNEALETHTAAVTANEKAQDAYAKQLKEIEKKFVPNSDSALKNEMKSVRGIKRLETALKKTPKGIELIDDIKKSSGIQLLTQGTLNPKVSPKKMGALLNDVNSRDFLKYTLGVDAVNSLTEVVKNIDKINEGLKKASNIKRALSTFKSVAKITPLRGTIAMVEGFQELMSKFTPAVKSASYQAIDPLVLKNIIENKDLILGIGGIGATPY